MNKLKAPNNNSSNNINQFCQNKDNMSFLAIQYQDPKYKINFIIDKYGFGI